MSEVLYRCERCGNARLLESFDGLLRFCSDGHEKETMGQVWPAPSGWISVEERLPWDDEGNENEREIYWLVYVVTPGKCFWTFDYYVDGIWETYGEYVTHYQPGPSAPE